MLLEIVGDVGSVQMLKKGGVVDEGLGPSEQEGVVWIRHEHMMRRPRFILLDQIIRGLAHGDVLVNASGLDPNSRQNDERGGRWG